jgi:hypothetical protein
LADAGKFRLVQHRNVHPASPTVHRLHFVLSEHSASAACVLARRLKADGYPVLFQNGSQI